VKRRALLAGAFLAALWAAAYLQTASVHLAHADRTAPAAAAAPIMPEPAVTSMPSPEPAPSEPLASATAPVPAPAPTPQTAASLPDLDPREALGSRSAPIVMEVFSDFQCPACKTLFIQTNRQLMDNYISTGKVYLVHRDFPLPMHAHSRVAAEYSRAAAQIGKLESVEQVLFENQEKWEQNGDVDGTVAGVLSSAEMTKVRALVKSATLDAAIEKDKALGNNVYRVTQTPTTIFHAHGQTFPYAGVMSWDILHQFLDQLLSQK
jgi:protein-disulfide isomerase